MQANAKEKEGTLLIVDSIPEDLVFAKSVLMQDFEIVIAPSVEMMQAFSGRLRPDLVLMDLRMAADLPALALGHADHRTPVIYFGENSPDAEVASYHAGGIGYIRKPYHAELLRRQVITLCRLITSISLLNDALRRETLLRESIDVLAYSFGGKRILLAEDMQINQLIIANMLSANQVEVDFADDGIAAVAQFSATPDAYAAILMDIQMPNMDGIAATRAIRSQGADRGKTIPIVALTASTTPDDIRKYRRIGMDAVLGKPVDREQLLRTLIELLAG